MNLDLETIEKLNAKHNSSLFDIEDNTWNAQATKNSLKEMFFATNSLQTSFGFFTFISLLTGFPFIYISFGNPNASLWHGIAYILSVGVSAFFAAQAIKDIIFYQKTKKFMLGEKHSLDELAKLKTNNFSDLLLKMSVFVVIIALCFALLYVPVEYRLYISIGCLIGFVILTNAGGLYGMRAIHMLENLGFLLTKIQEKLKKGELQ